MRVLVAEDERRVADAVVRGLRREGLAVDHAPDGEQAHPVRVVLVDLAASKVLLRSRHFVDPSWIRPARRATSATGFDSCALALDVLDDVRKAR